MRQWRVRAAVALLLVVVVYATAIHTPPGPRSIRHFEPDRMADLEVAMWQAYYSKSKLTLFRLLVQMHDVVSQAPD